MPKRYLVFLSPHDPKNVLNWSGTLHTLYHMLDKESARLTLLPLSGGLLDKLAEQLNRVLFFIGIRFDCRFSKFYALCAGLYVSVRLWLLPDGPILAVAASNYAPYLITKREIIYISDVPFRAAAMLYPNLRALPTWLYRQFDQNEARTLRRANAIILPSSWASDSAKIDYGAHPSKIFELPFGSNIPDETAKEYCTPKTIVGKAVNLLIVSADWERKGGDKAVAICRALRTRGIAARLIIVGDSPKEVRQLGFVDAKGFLNKADSAQLKTICRSYQQAHFLLLPTIADASPIVFSECRAFGVPPVTHIVGGTASAIEHGHTGLLLPLNASPDEFADVLIPYIQEHKMYARLCQECRNWYVEKAQWANWSKLILELVGLNDSDR